MKKHFALVSLLAAFLVVGFIIGCSEENPVRNDPGNEGGSIYSITLQTTHHVIRGFEGDERSETITATARDINNVAVPGVPIRFSILQSQSYKGTLVRAGTDTLTDLNGVMTATYTVELSDLNEAPNNIITIEARNGSVTQSIDLDVSILDNEIGGISLQAPNVVTAPQNQAATATVTASLLDTSGIAIPNILIKFRTEPIGLGYLDSDTGSTNLYGQVSKTFTSVVGRTGQCKIFASVGNHEESTTIDVQPTSEPEYIRLFTATPNITVVPNQNGMIDLQGYVTDEFGIGVPGITVKFKLLPEGNGAIFGSLNPIDTTDAFGQVITIFNTLGGSGKVKCRAQVLPTDADDEESGIFVDKVITVTMADQAIGQLNVSASPSFMLLQKDTTGVSKISARVVDSENVGLKNLPVKFSTEFGSLANVTVTDCTGIATANFFFMPANDWPDDVEDNRIEVVVTAEVAGTPFKATKIVTIEQTSGEFGKLELSHQVPFIFADFGLTNDTLTAVLKDADNQVLFNQPIIFTSTHGTVNSPVQTDSFGVAKSVFKDNGIPSTDELGNIIPAQIIAKYNPMSLTAVVECEIRERNPVDRITLISDKNQMQAGSGDSATVKATAFLANGDHAPNNTLVNFEVDNGTFSQPTVPIAGNYGIAETRYVAGNLKGPATLKATINNGEGVVESNEFIITLVPGNPSRIQVVSNPGTLTTNDPAALSTITATVRDTANNPVDAGHLVTFETSLGSLERTATTTDDQGRAVTYLRPGVSAGVAQITATNTQGVDWTITGVTTVTFLAGGSNSLTLDADPLQIAVAGTGGITTSTLRATLFDANGNKVETAQTVIFQLINESPEPEGCNFNNHGQIDSAQTAGGVAVVSLNAGTEVGGKLIRAFTWRDAERQDTVSVILSRVAVIAGPPFDIDIDINEDGENRDGGVWALEVAARVFDLYLNPVAGNIPVVFSCIPDVASIEAAYTGNESANGVTTDGVAYSVLTYNSQNTFDTLTIYAEIAGVDGQIEGSRETVLPLQDGELVLNIDPSNWMIDAQGYTRANVRCWGTLKDGHNVLINNGPILFGSSRARFYWYDYSRDRYELYAAGTPVRKYTGWRGQKYGFKHNDNDGQATVFLQGEDPDFFLDLVTPEINVNITAEVEGYPDVVADPQVLVVTRHP